MHACATWPEGRPGMMPRRWYREEVVLAMEWQAMRTPGWLIGLALGCSESAVYWNLSRARRLGLAAYPPRECWA
jgi:hypothetical protein